MVEPSATRTKPSTGGVVARIECPNAVNATEVVVDNQKGARYDSLFGEKPPRVVMYDVRTVCGTILISYILFVEKIQRLAGWPAVGVGFLSQPVWIIRHEL